ncbi:MAG: hemolysin family protein [Flavobacteriales bacterium]
MTPTDLTLLIAAVLLSALSSGLEIAFVSANKLYVELQRKQGDLGARMLAGLYRRPHRVIGALLVGNNIGVVVYSLMLAKVLDPWLRNIYPHEWFVLAGSTIISTLLILVSAEYLPKSVFRIDPNGILGVFAVPLQLLYVILWLPMMVFTGLSELVLRLIGVRTKPGQPVFGRIDLDEFLKQVSESTPADKDMDAEVGYFRNTLELSNTKARDRMVPRADIEAIDVDSEVPQLQKRFSDTGLSKLLVYKDGIDNIIGYVHGYEMFRRPRTVRSVMRPVNFIPGTMPVDQVLQLFTKQKAHVAVVVDEFGGTAGMLTIEDVVETIVGDINDEHDLGEVVEEKLGEHEYLFSGGVEVEHLVAQYDLDIPVDEDFGTLAGWILHHTEELPEQGAVLEIGPFRLTIAQVGHGRIDLVRLLVADPSSGLKR